MRKSEKDWREDSPNQNDTGLARGNDAKQREISDNIDSPDDYEMEASEEIAQDSPNQMMPRLGKNANNAEMNFRNRSSRMRDSSEKR